MITTDDVRKRLKEVPFQPFRIVTSSGEKYEIQHPDSVLATRRVLYVGIDQPRNPDVPDQATHVSVLHITDLQPLSETSNTIP
ncbi:MAG: hypothetical protein LC104_18010 [Bacteroidales bacterium]|nr:hypothetical protein [Bacteroidales bacterium]